MRLTRKQLLAGAAASALGAGGIYELVDKLGEDEPKRRAAAFPAPDEQHLLDSVSVIVDNEVEVVVPPLQDGRWSRCAEAPRRRSPRAAFRADRSESGPPAGAQASPPDGRAGHAFSTPPKRSAQSKEAPTPP